MNKFTAFAIFLLLAACQSRKRSTEVFPSFDILLSDSTTHINTGLIEKGRPTVLLYFSPDCEHCQKETEDIIKHMDLLKMARFYFVTCDPFDRLKAFIGHYRLDKYNNITIGRDEQFYLVRHFKGIAPPYLMLYDKEKKQRASYQGNIVIDTLISLVNNL